MGFIKGSLGAFAGSMAVWLSFIYLVAKFLDKKFPCD